MKSRADFMNDSAALLVEESGVLAQSQDDVMQTWRNYSSLRKESGSTGLARKENAAWCVL